MLLLHAAYTDITKRKVADITTSAMWVLLVVYSWLIGDYSGLVCAAAAFAFIYAYNSLWALFKDPAFGWGDVLVFPIFIGFIFLMLPSIFLQILGGIFPIVLCAAVIIYTKNAKQPFVAYLFIGFFIAFIALRYRLLL
jgi:hypothetical protein